MSVHVLASNLKRLMSILGVSRLETVSQLCGQPVR